MLAVLAAAAVLAAPQGFYEAKVLEPAARFVAGKPSIVYCASTNADWRAFLDVHYPEGSTANGSAEPGSATVHLSRVVCSYLRPASTRTAVLTSGLAASILTLTHESIHLRGERDEGVTDCSAVHEMPRVSVKFFHVKAGAQLRALMAAAWAYRGRESAQYRTVC